MSLTIQMPVRIHQKMWWMTCCWAKLRWVLLTFLLITRLLCQFEETSVKTNFCLIMPCFQFLLGDLRWRINNFFVLEIILHWNFLCRLTIWSCCLTVNWSLRISWGDIVSSSIQTFSMSTSIWLAVSASMFLDTDLCSMQKSASAMLCLYCRVSSEVSATHDNDILIAGYSDQILRYVVTPLTLD